MNRLPTKIYKCHRFLAAYGPAGAMPQGTHMSVITRIGLCVWMHPAKGRCTMRRWSPDDAFSSGKD